MKNRILALVAAVFMLVSLTGCETITFNVLELMSPPKATGNKADIQKLIDEQAGTDYTLKYPQNGTYRSAITTIDFDNDGAQEAVAFYTPSGEAETVHLLVMDTKEGEWVVLGNHKSKHQTVDTLDFADLDGNGTLEIVAGWRTYNTLVNELSVFITDKDGCTELTTSNTYSSILCDDFTGDSKDELLLLSLYTTDKPALASLVALNDTKNSLYCASTCDIDSSITSFAQTLTGEVFAGQFGAVLDGVTGDNNYSTQVIYYSNESKGLKCVKFTKDTPTNQAVRTYAVLSEDIDGDGIIEIPNAFKTKTDKAQTEAIPAILIYWCNLTPKNTLAVKTTTVSSLIYGFNFEVPQRWGNDFTAFINYTTNEVVFYELSEDGALGDSLLIFKIFPKDSWNSNTSTGYTKLASNDSYVYSYIIPESNSSKILTNEEIEKAFTLI